MKLPTQEELSAMPPARADAWRMVAALAAINNAMKDAQDRAKQYTQNPNERH
jgi:hypothetical protein